MHNEIVVNAIRGETRVGILERGSLSELLIERAAGRSMVGNVVKGRVSRVLPGMQASFVDIGLEKAAFLYAGDYFEYDRNVDLGDDDNGGRGGRGGGGRGRGRPGGRNGGGRQVPRIDTILSEGQEIMVQVAKEPIGTKGARITSHVAIAGRHLVLTPSGSRVGVSRRIESDRERRRLRDIVEQARPRDVGFIIRTAGEGAREADLQADLKYLVSVWEQIQSQRESAQAPAVLYAEPPLPLRVVRDVASSDTRRIVVDNETVYEELRSFVARFCAEPRPRVELYKGTRPIFDHFGIEAAIDANLGRKVWLKSGGYLIIDQSEALTAVDVNTGRYVGKRDLEDTVLKTNLEAVKEAVHQLRFRNIGGLIILDLIDMETAENREKVYRALQEAVRQDKAKTNILKISELGLVEMTRKRTRENLVQQLCEPCSHCQGRGYVLSRESVTYKVLREIRNDLPRFCGRRIAVSVNPRVAEVLLGAERESLAEMEEQFGRSIEVRAVPGVHQEHFEVIALDEGSPVSLQLPWLGLGEDGPTDTEPILFSEPFEEELSKPSEPSAAPAAPAVLDVPGLIEGRPEVALAELARVDGGESPPPPDPVDILEPDPGHLGPADELEPPERRTLVARTLSPAGESGVADLQPVDETPESPILPDSSESEA
ncbi:Rne/Rng family ribonuclease [Myxococcota bacterium]|nr:Rne/Rng family ribonuclease [Myxococcota bacterium]